jgi:hypothetical protein
VIWRRTNDIAAQFAHARSSFFSMKVVLSLRAQGRN